ncbi:flagellar basal body rod protein FlgB [Ramlibacter humi]|uniref:Flagellar basal body rod protein FlgB n=1 Tax=Ramlibacter humi TaxID=2530451 RepID=A0A4Z0BCU0_9BURK|nr:flagellar basal body rod protein FlgB [Ramlibacter humi]TFY97086.1 flagellar basal body rod protein FlgB [Ramlibacter humi]
MTQQLEAITTAALSLGLEAASRRHETIAANIANAATEGYVPVRLSFEDRLAEARQTLRDKGSVDAFALAGVRMQVEPATDAQGRPVKVQVDQEMAEMARNAVQYQALTQGLSRHLSILAAAAADGKK